MVEHGRWCRRKRSGDATLFATDIIEFTSYTPPNLAMLLLAPVPGGDSVRSQGSLPRAPPADRFSGPVLSDQESRHELPALPIIVDHRAGRANGSWLPALPVPRLRAAVQ